MPIASLYPTQNQAAKTSALALDVNQMLCGQIVWACGFEENNFKTSMLYMAKPVCGILTDKKKPHYIANPALENEPWNLTLKDTNDPTPHFYANVPRYFVPFKKGTMEPAWSKAVGLYSRICAATEKDCYTLYLAQIDRCMDWHKQRTDTLLKHYEDAMKDYVKLP